jgi:hypothetical protein
MAFKLNEDTFYYPVEMAQSIGLNKNEINALKTKGCPFFGKKTTIRIVRAFLFKTMEAESLIRQK